LWFYTFAELVAFGQSRGQQRVSPLEIEKRRAALEKYRQQKMPPELIWYNPHSRQWWPAQTQDEKVKESSLAEQVFLRGIAASAGTGPVEGLAVVSDNVEEAIERILQLSGPVILITHVTDPVWSSLFSRLTAVVTEMGGAISHAATVARENGIPAVVGVQEATRRIRTGQRVRVDGSAGLVEVVG
jgi:pyruvate,water dikinase